MLAKKKTVVAAIKIHWRWKFTVYDAYASFVQTVGFPMVEKNVSFSFNCNCVLISCDNVITINKSLMFELNICANCSDDMCGTEWMRSSNERPTALSATCLLASTSSTYASTNSSKFKSLPDASATWARSNIGDTVFGRLELVTPMVFSHNCNPTTWKNWTKKNRVNVLLFHCIHSAISINELNVNICMSLLTSGS